ncbi:O-antigen ligase family protein, partial [Priestia megaterium]|uniref:O-antigen ligase family protein n=1 Tax=Priestia megaterium TaxID=1404 RepID=UPI002FFED70D
FIAILRIGKTLSVNKINNRENIISKKIIFHSFLFLILFCCILLSNYYTLGSNYSLEKTLKFSTFTAWAFFGVYFLINDRKSLRNFLKSLALIALIMSLYTVLGLKESSGVESGFTSVAGDNYLGLGRSSGLGALIFISLYITTDSKKFVKILSICSVLIILTALFASGSRMPLISFIIVFLTAFFISVKVRKGIVYIRKGFSYFIALLGLGIISILALASTGIFDTVIRRLSILFTETDGGTSAEGRLERYQTAYEAWINHPIFGTGVGSFPIHFDGFDKVDYPHNIFLELLSELGLIGLLIFLLFILYPIYNVISNRKTKSVFLHSEILTSLFCFMFFFLNACTTGDINDNRLLFTFSSLVVISCILNNRNKDVTLNNVDSLKDAS